MKNLEELLKDVISSADVVIHQQNIIINKICYNSSKCIDNSIFCALPPLTEQSRDGINYIPNALKNGAKVIVTKVLPITKQKEITYIITENPALLFSKLCYSFYSNPQKKLKILGVTGTDGKTTTCEFLYQMMKMEGQKCGILSTVSMDYGQGRRSSLYRQSTPEADVLSEFLDKCVYNGLEYVVLETTSHALSPLTSRVAPIEFDGTIFTSITKEHLDFHINFQDYLNSKLNLAKQLKTNGLLVTSPLNNYKSQILEVCKSPLTTPKFPLQVLKQEIDHMIINNNIHFCYGENCYLENAILAYTMFTSLLNLDFEKNLNIFESLKRVEGRFFLTKRGNVTYIIDFAHTAKAYENLFSFLRKLYPEAYITAVFGEGGFRDREKRWEMGKLASHYCSKVVITEEDPRDEDPENIYQDIIRKVDEKDLFKVTHIENRKNAILKACNEAKENSFVLLLGKGKEKTIARKNGEKISWDEKKMLLEIIDLKETK